MRDKIIKLPLWLIAFFTVISIIAPVRVLSETRTEKTQAGEVQIEVNGGFDGIARLGAYSPVRIKVSMINRNISGEIQVEASLDPGRKMLFTKLVELSPGGETVFYFEIPVVSAKKDLIIRIVENKKALVEKEFSFKRLLPPETVLIGVLTEEPESFKWMNGYMVPCLTDRASDEKMRLMIASGQTVQSPLAVPSKDSLYEKREAVVVSFDRGSFPDNSKVMDAFNYLIISKFDTGLLSETQTSTMENWADSGGIIILGTGLYWQKAYNGLPDSLKPFSIEDIIDFNATETFDAFTGRGSPTITLKTAKGTLGFEYIPHSDTDYYENTEYSANHPNTDIIVGSDRNPLVIKYAKGFGYIAVFTFDLTLEPFVSWPHKAYFMENVFRHIGSNNQRFYQNGQDYYLKQNYNSVNIQHLVNEVPGDKNPPFFWMFLSLGIYIILAGPMLYLILKKCDRRDWAWVIIPTLSIVFLGGMYVFGFKSRYNSAVSNSISIIKAQAGKNEATVSSAIGVFNNKRGTLKLEYEHDNGIEVPFLQNDNRYYGNETDGIVVGKYTTGDNIMFEQYNVMLWTPLILNAEKTIPFDGDILRDVYFKDGALEGSITNTSPYDMLDAVILTGRNIIPIGNIVAGDTTALNIPLESNENLYKRTQDYLDGEFGRTYYRSTKEYPENYREMMRKRNIFQDYIYSITKTGIKLVLLARNEQIIDYGVIVNNKKPEEYSHNLICVESALSFLQGEEVEIPGGIIEADMYQSGEIGWLEDENSIRINNTGEMELRFILPDMLDYTELSISVENYIPLYTKYNMSDNPDTQTEILKNKYKYYLYNTKSQIWDSIGETVNISEGAKDYIGYGNEVLMRIGVVEIGQPSTVDRKMNYEQELLSMPEISVKGVAK